MTSGNPPTKFCKECGKLCWGNKCKKCLGKKRGLPISKWKKYNLE